LWGRRVGAVKAGGRSGRRELAAECAGRALALADKNGRADEALDLLEPIFDDQRYVVLSWWAALRKDKPDEEPAATMNRVLAFASGQADRKEVDRLATLLVSFKAAPP